MAGIPVRFKRVAEVFDEASRAGNKLCESSGSEHSSAESLTDLVKSFLERETTRSREDNNNSEKNKGEGIIINGGELSEENDACSDSDETTKDMLRGLLMGCELEDDVKHEIYLEAEQACADEMGNGSLSSSFKRRLMTRLRDRGFDAGLCKSKWEKNGRILPGNYEYIDVNIGITRYIIEVSLGAEFQIARPTNSYTSLLDEFPQIFVGKVEELKRIVSLMSNAIKRSMKSMDMHVPPWRRHGYMHAKWFGSYKRTINEVSLKKGAFESNEDLDRNKAFGFSPMATISYFCREEFASKVGMKVGNLAAALNQPSLPL